MILMAALIYLPLAAIGAIGVAIIALHDLVGAPVAQALGRITSPWLAQILYFGGDISLGGGENGPQLAVLYSIIPWIGVMAAGYAFGRVMTMESERRRRLCFAVGAGAIVAFLVLRGFNIYGDPRPWGDAARLAASQRRAAQQQPPAGQAAPAPNAGSGQTPATAQPPGAQRRPPQPRTPALLQFLGTNKYPASLLFLLMTLGPTILLIPLLDGARGPLARVMTTFGRVPLFYYVLHIPLIHLIFVGLSIARFGSVIPWMTANHPMGNPPPPPGYMYSLTALYAITLLAVTILYFPCRWFAELRTRRTDRWLSYL
jgi:uncharacterized membrane protein